MADQNAARTIEKAIASLDRWADGIESRTLRKIRRSALYDLQQKCLSELAAYRFEAPAGADFRTLMSNIALVASRESSDNMLEQWLRSFSKFLRKQLRARDPFNWKGEARSQLYGLEIVLPRKDWPYSFTDK
jgi:hypothetical protein